MVKWLFILPMIFATGCKTIDNSNLQTLTAEEQKTCNFNGKRFMLLFSPDFIEDANAAQEIFGNSSPTYMIDEAYASKNFEPKKLDDCFDRLQELGKYELIADKRARGATWKSFQQKMAYLKKQIIKFRRNHPKEEIQVLLLISSHGDVEQGAGKILFSDFQPNYRQFMDFVHASTMTQCLTNECQQFRRGTVKMANEVIILMDNCYSGNLITDMKATLETKPGYQQSAKIQSPKANQTRVVAFSASAIGQTAVGAVRQGKVGTLMFALQQTLPPKWLGDLNEDNRISLKELDDFVKNDLPGAIATGAVSQARKFAAGLICGDPGKRNDIWRSYKKNPEDFKQLLKKPMRYVKLFDLPGKIQQPMTYNNLSDNMMNKLVMAVTAPSKKGAHISDAARRYHQTLKNNIKAATTRVPVFLDLADRALRAIEKDPDLLKIKIPPSAKGKGPKTDGAATPAPGTGGTSGQSGNQPGNTPTGGGSGSGPIDPPRLKVDDDHETTGHFIVEVLTEEQLGIKKEDKALRAYYIETCVPDPKVEKTGSDPIPVQRGDQDTEFYAVGAN